MFSIFKKKKKTTNKLPSLGDGYRINRIIRTEWNAGNCEQINQFHHYWVPIDGVLHRYGIVEILGAIEALEQFERA